ncbi:MAG TPA: FAD:protein FMN transferase [Mucilaginibacter sp.]|jgi:thiamine biosynthesis lipoprotein|nr:FAD:protein FMN transferase [Mucilaginibacter sp.]
MLAVKTYNNNQHIFRRELRLMGNRFEISVVGNDDVWALKCIDAAAAEINRVEKLLSALTDDGQVTEINRHAGQKPVKVNAEIFRLIERALAISELTDGAFDITYNTENDAKTASYRQVILNSDKTTVYLRGKGMRIGFSAISRGYAADRAKYALQLLGVSSGVVNAGGDLLAWGLQPDNQPWTIASADPQQKMQPYADIKISNMAVATSGDFDKNAAINDVMANIDTKRGFPVSELKRVSVVSPTAELSDAMATPVMTMGVNAGLYLINKLQQLACVIIDDHDRVYTSKEISFLT